MKHFPLTAAAFEGSLVAVAIVLGWLLDAPPLKTFSFDWVAALYGGGAALPPLVVFGLCLQYPVVGPIRRIAKIVDAVLVPLFRQCRFWELAVIAGLAGLGEEMLFRGVIQAAVADGVGGPRGLWLGLAVSAALFGMLHSVTPTYALLAGMVGLYLGWLWLLSGNLLVPVVAHGVYDFLMLWYLVRRRSG